MSAAVPINVPQPDDDDYRPPRLSVVPHDGLVRDARRFRRIQALFALLILPAAVALTVIAIGLPTDTTVSPNLPPASVTSPLAALTRGVGDAQLRVEVVAGDRALATLLEQAGLSVERTVTPAAGTAGSARTMIVYYDEQRRGQALEVKRILGAGSVLRAPALNSAVDLTIFVGRDLPKN